jgi:hypothetical protein
MGRRIWVLRILPHLEPHIMRTSDALRSPEHSGWRRLRGPSCSYCRWLDRKDIRPALLQGNGEREVREVRLILLEHVSGKWILDVDPSTLDEHERETS